MPNYTNPIDLGAAGDGINDDSSYLQEAIDTGASTVDLLGKTYRCDKPLILRSGLRIKGSGATLNFSECPAKNVIGLVGTNKVITGKWLPLLHLYEEIIHRLAKTALKLIGRRYIRYGDAGRVTLEDFSIKGRGNDVFFRDCVGITIQRVDTTNVKLTANRWRRALVTDCRFN